MMQAKLACDMRKSAAGICLRRLLFCVAIRRKADGEDSSLALRMTGVVILRSETTKDLMSKGVKLA